MSAREIDEYLEGLDEPQRSALEQLRRTILAIVPDAEQGISYNMPAFRIDGKVVAGFAAFTNHLAYLPHSNSVLATVAPDIAGYTATKGSLHFAPDASLPAALVEKLIAAKRAEIAAR